jgi:hypothetical protein
MILGDRVSFSWKKASGEVVNGEGEIVSVPTSTHCLVAMDPKSNPIAPEGPHIVIWCTLTWLTAIS